MTEKIQNIINIEVENLDLTQIENVEFYIRQGGRFFLKKPEIINSNYMKVVLLFEEAMQLTNELPCQMQFCYTLDGNEYSSEVVEQDVEILLKEEGYNIG